MPTPNDLLILGRVLFSWFDPKLQPTLAAHRYIEWGGGGCIAQSILLLTQQPLVRFSAFPRSFSLHVAELY